MNLGATVPGTFYLIWTIVGQGPTILAVGAGGDCLIFFLSPLSYFFSFPLSGRQFDID